MKTRFHWLIGGGLVVGVLLLLGAGTIEDSGIFQSLKLGGRTNLVSDDNVDLTYNGAHYQRSVPILNNLTNGIGTNLTSLLPSAVQAAQVNGTSGITNAGMTVNTPSAVQSLTTASNVVVNASTLCVAGSGGAVTLATMPSIQTNGIADGTIITIRGTSDANTVTFQDYRTLTGSCISLETTSITLANGGEARFQWSNGNQRWQSLGFSANGTQNHPFKDITVSTINNLSITSPGQDSLSITYPYTGAAGPTNYNNLGIGTRALINNTTGNKNVGIGPSALFSNTTGYNNTGVGVSVFSANTTGTDNTAIGEGAMSFNTTGSFNNAIGEGTLSANTTGSWNTANGYSAMQWSTTGIENTAEGYYAMNKNLTGSGNSTVGFYGLEENTTGSYNTSIGYQSLQFNTSGSNNVAVGCRSLFSNTTGSNNTAIGFAADVGSGNLTNSTAIGNGALATLPNQMVFGNANVTQTLLHGNVGIGTSPSNTLHVLGQTISGVSPYTVNGTSFGSLSTSGNIGLVAAGNYAGSTFALPASPLGSAYVNSGLVGLSSKASGGNPVDAIGVFGYGRESENSGGASYTVGGKFVSDTSTNAGSVAANTGGYMGVWARADTSPSVASAGTLYGVYSTATGKSGDTTYGGSFSASGGTANYGLVVNSGNVGLGTLTPSEKLEVSGNIKVSGTGNSIQGGHTNQIATSGTPQTIFYVSVPNTNSLSGDIIWKLFSTDGTDVQAQTGHTLFDSVAKGTTVTAGLTSITNSAVVTGGSTLSGGLTANVTTNNVLAIQATLTTSLTTTNMLIKWRIQTPSVYSVTAL